VLNVQPLPQGPLREDLLEICRAHKVKVRELLVWHTSGMMLNAAVMGLVGGVRYVLMTDALLELMTREQVRGVMSHEIGHVRRHHLPWLAAALMAILGLAEIVSESPIYLLAAFHPQLLQSFPGWAQLILIAIALAGAFTVFGWVCRRFERQADTFAVQHLSATQTAADSALSDRVTPAAVIAMDGALDAIARLNAIDPSRHSWRHGSITWRQRYLRSIVGLPLNNLPIDRLIRTIKLWTAAGLAMVACYIVLSNMVLLPMIDRAQQQQRERESNIVLRGQAPAPMHVHR
jgi:Zn-dependent protease with chaperone function